MRKTPAPTKTQGALKAQLPLIPTPALSPTMPSRTTKAWLALNDLLDAPLTQPQWLRMGRGWRLAASINRLLDLGWPITSCWVLPPHYTNPIKRYWLEPEGKRLAYLAMKERTPC